MVEHLDKERIFHKIDTIGTHTKKKKKGKENEIGLLPHATHENQFQKEQRPIQKF